MRGWKREREREKESDTEPLQNGEMYGYEIDDSPICKIS